MYIYMYIRIYMYREVRAQHAVPPRLKVFWCSLCTYTYIPLKFSMYIYICICVCVCISTSIYMYVFICIAKPEPNTPCYLDYRSFGVLYVYMCISPWSSLRTCMYICIYMYIYIYMYVYVYIHIHIYMYIYIS